MKCVLNDIIKDIQTGPFGSQLHRSEYSDEGTPVIMPQDIVDWNISTEKIVRIGNSHVDRLARHKVEYLDIIYPRRGDVSKCAQITNEIGWLCGTGCLKVKIDSEKANPQYVFYYLQQPHVGKWIELHSTGATMMNINSSTLRELPLDIPEYEIQNKICEIISNYDSLIANCRKQIALLEEAAQRLYREWFVNFRFPGHESTPIIDALPQGWTYGVVENLGKFVRGKNLLTTDAIPGNVPVIAGGLTPSCWHNISNTSCPVITASGSGANAGYTAIHNIPVWAADCSFLDTSQSEFLYYIYCFLKENSSLLKSKQKGSAQPHVYAKDINSCVLVIPENSILSKFENTVCKYFEEIGQFKSLITRLKDARDILLPRLMSGEIDVSEISNHCLENSVGKKSLHTGQPSSGT